MFMLLNIGLLIHGIKCSSNVLCSVVHPHGPIHHNLRKKSSWANPLCLIHCSTDNTTAPGIEEWENSNNHRLMHAHTAMHPHTSHTHQMCETRLGGVYSCPAYYTLRTCAHTYTDPTAIVMGLNAALKSNRQTVRILFGPQKSRDAFIGNSHLGSSMLDKGYLWFLKMHLWAAWTVHLSLLSKFMMS